MKLNINNIAYNLGVFGVAITLLWIGLYKFTKIESLAIMPLVENHFGMNWMYKIMSIQGVSNIIGLFEIITGIGLSLSFVNKKTGMYAGLASMVIFSTTLSFILTTPGIFTIVDGSPFMEHFITMDFFILKDIPFLAVSLMVYAKNREQKKLKTHLE